MRSSRPGDAACTRRGFLRTALGVAGATASLSACAGARGGGPSASAPTASPKPPVGGSADPSPIPWLDKNGSHNQSPGPGQEPSNIYHFQGRVARANAFTGSGTDGRGARLAFGAPSTDFSFLDGEYFAADRIARRAVWSHL